MNVLNKHYTIWNFRDDFSYDFISKWKNMFLSFRADFVFDFGCMAIYGTTVHWPCLLTMSCTICSSFQSHSGSPMSPTPNVNLTWMTAETTPRYSVHSACHLWLPIETKQVPQPIVVSVLVSVWSLDQKVSSLYDVLHIWIWKASCLTLETKGGIEYTHHLWL